MKIAASDPAGVVFPLIAEPASYRAHTVDLLRDERRLCVWLDIFRHHRLRLRDFAIESEVASGGGQADATRRADVFVDEFGEMLDTIEHDPTAFGEPCVPLICTLRERVLRACGFADPYRPVKQRENDAALRLLPALLAELDAIESSAGVDASLRVHVEGVFAGNIFDLGAAATIQLFDTGGIDFHAVRAKLPDRPWLVDDLDALTARLADDSPGRAVLFVDNAGADVVLGMIPFSRHLLRRGWSVILTANSTPALNDITFDELGDLLARIDPIDATLADARSGGAGRLTLLPSGNGIPLIDLSRVSPQLADAVRSFSGGDLLVLEGMGRALESNYQTRFTCDTLKLAMIKEQDVAEQMTGKMYDVICRFEPS